MVRFCKDEFMRETYIFVILVLFFAVACVAPMDMPMEEDEPALMDPQVDIESGALASALARPANLGPYQLVAQHSSRCLEVEAASTANAADVQQGSCTGAGHQKWTLQELGGGWYYIKASHSDKCLQIEAESMANGADAQQWACAGAGAQKWKLENLGTNWYYIKAQHSDKCLEITDGSTASGAMAQQWTCSGANHQKWQLQSG